MDRTAILITLSSTCAGGAASGGGTFMSTICAALAVCFGLWAIVLTIQGTNPHPGADGGRGK